MEIRINGDTIRFIYDDDLQALVAQGEATTLRASHVEPIGAEWFVDLSPCNGPKLGPFQLKQDALDAEVSWLQNNKIPVPNQAK